MIRRSGHKFYANKKQEYAGKLKVAFITDDVEFYGLTVASRIRIS